MKIEVNIEKRYFYILSALLILLIGSFGVWAYGTSNPSNVGHTIEEIQGAASQDYVDNKISEVRDYAKNFGTKCDFEGWTNNTEGYTYCLSFGFSDSDDFHSIDADYYSQASCSSGECLNNKFECVDVENVQCTFGCDKSMESMKCEDGVITQRNPDVCLECGELDLDINI